MICQDLRFRTAVNKRLVGMSREVCQDPLPSALSRYPDAAKYSTACAVFKFARRRRWGPGFIDWPVYYGQRPLIRVEDLTVDRKFSSLSVFGY